MAPDKYSIKTARNLLKKSVDALLGMLLTAVTEKCNMGKEIDMCKASCCILSVQYDYTSAVLS